MWAVAHSERPARKPRVLYVDDDPQHLQLYSLTLRDEFNVVTAQGAEQGLRVFEQQGPFEVVISDMRMPRMNGTDFLSRVRAIDDGVVRILLTGDADLDSAMRAVNEAFAFRYLTKPCARADLASALRSATSEHRRGAEPRATLRLVRNDEPRSAPDARAFAGQVIADRYEVHSLLGAGGTAVVLRCRDRMLDTHVGLKLFPRDLDEISTARIKRELMVMRELSHPNITRCYDIGQHEGAPFITMELLSGRDLRSRLLSGDLTPTLAVDCLIQACRGLQHAHDVGVTHRDVKPDNLFLGDDGVLHVMDFGLAKKARDANLTRPNMTGGTFQYMAPEQIHDLATVTPAADVYALGVVAYELLTGRCPFDYEDPRAILTAHLTRMPAPPSTVAPGLPQDLDAIVMMALAKDPMQRFRSCNAFAAALMQVVW